MKYALRITLAVVAGMALAFVLIVAVEFFSIAMPATFFVACLIGIRSGGWAPSAHAGRGPSGGAAGPG